MMSNRIVVPASLRHNILQLLHAALQGIDRMKSRASESVFWPGIVGDIAKTRWSCLDCHKMAPSNPYIAEEYGKYGLVLAERE